MENVKKGISPIVGIVLMLAITIAIAAAAFFWINSIMRGAQSETERKLETRLELDALECYSNGDGPDNYRIAVTNVGGVPIDTSSVNIIVKDLTDKLIVASTITNFGGITKLEPNNFAVANITSLGNLISKGNSYKVELRFIGSSYSISQTCSAR